MPRKTKVLTVSLPDKLSDAVDELSERTHQTRSELIRNALRGYFLDMEDDARRFEEAYASSRDEKGISMNELKKKFDLV